MSARIVAALADGVLASAPDDTDSDVADLSSRSAVWDVITGVFDALGDNGYQTGSALIVSTFVIVALVNLRTNKFVIGAAAIGAFWAGWLAWNTVTNNDNQLFPGEIQATKLWDVAFTSDIGFLFVVLVACLLAAVLWRKGIGLGSRVIVLIGGVLGASLIYNLYESLRAATESAG